MTSRTSSRFVLDGDDLARAARALDELLAIRAASGASTRRLVAKYAASRDRFAALAAMSVDGREYCLTALDEPMLDVVDIATAASALGVTERQARRVAARLAPDHAQLIGRSWVIARSAIAGCKP